MANYPRSISEKSKRRRSRTFERAVVAEFTLVAAGAFVVLFAITLVTQLVRLLGQAAGGAIAGDAVLAFLGFRSLNVFPVLLSISLFIGVLLVLTRSYRDSEMVIWFSSGLSLSAWVRPVLLFALPLAGAIALLTLLLSPWADGRVSDYQQELDARDDASQISPGVFHESRHANRVFFVEAIAGDQRRVANIFVQSVERQRLGIVVAREGYQGVDEKGDRYVVLEKGSRFEGEPGSAEFRLTEFDRYQMSLEQGNRSQGIRPPTSLATPELLRDPNSLNLAEFQWRVGVPVSALVLALMGIPLSFVNPRGGRSVNLIIALLVYATYSNLLSMMRLWVALGKVSAVTGFFAVHGAMIGLLILLFFRRRLVRALLSVWR